ncbi:ATP-binding protein [Castellaniella sp. GW247-6E4]|uniref:ATP-binding protein n=1 Tax=Castellaniella sp. GW247-6E4 TaxID=3140380 RepID=UPI00331592B5
MRLAAGYSSLRTRLLAGTLAWVLVSVLAAGWGIQTLFRQHIEAQLRSELVIHLDQLTATIQVDPHGGLSLSAPPADPRFSQPFSGLYWQVEAPSDAPGAPRLLRSRSLWDTELPGPAAPAGPVEGDHAYSLRGPQGQALLVLARQVEPAEGPWPVLALRVAADQALLAEPIGRFNAMLGAALGVLALGLVLAVLMQVWVGLRPLERLRLALGAVREGRTQHIEGEFPSEIQPLVEDFNRVLRSNAEAVERARTQAGNLAHALKTPLTVIANAADAGDPRLPALVGEQVAAARRQVDYHLAQARAAAAIRRTGMRSPVLPLLHGLVQVMRRVHAQRGVVFELEAIPESLAFRGEAQDFQEMLGNVLDNAGKWARRRVRVRASPLGPDRLRLMIEDDGPGLAPGQAEVVFQRGRRADEHAPGTGLGLSIVRDLAGLYGGEARFEDGSELGGACLVLILPRA